MAERRDEDRGVSLPWDATVNRRQMLHGVGAAAFICALQPATRGKSGSLLEQAGQFDVARYQTSAGLRAAARVVPGDFESDLPIPPVLDPTTSSPTLDEYEVTMEPSTTDIIPGQPTPIFGYNGTFPGPTIYAERGRAVNVLQRNRRGDGVEAVVHLHGGLTAPEHDGHPEDVIADGADRLYEYENEQLPGILWYHDHVHGHTARSVYQGLAGMYILRDTDKESRLGLPHGKYDVPLMIADRSFNADGSFSYPGFPIFSGPGFSGNKVLVNGAIAPRMKVKQRLYRFRVLNASNARCYALQLSNGARIAQIGNDGGFLRRPFRRGYIPLAPAQRADILIDFRNVKAGKSVVLKNLADPPLGGTQIENVMRFDVTSGGGAEDARIPDRLRGKLVMPPVATTRTFELSLKAGVEWQINGQGFDHNRIDADPKIDTSEIWKFVNKSGFTHPMHIHLVHFKVMSVNGIKPPAAEAVLRDTVIVGPFQTVRVRPHFKGHTGVYVFHCHALEHGDTNMMGQMEVVA